MCSTMNRENFNKNIQRLVLFQGCCPRDNWYYRVSVTHCSPVNWVDRYVTVILLDSRHKDMAGALL